MEIDVRALELLPTEAPGLRQCQVITCVWFTIVVHAKNTNG
ncbi:hypothetical protein [Acrocarpospora macrocephala]|nr:hypothetical protein [Acrocarpospora macrocephala]